MHFWETSCWLAWCLLRLYKLNKPTLLLAQSKSELQCLSYDQNRNIIASRQASYYIARLGGHWGG